MDREWVLSENEPIGTIVTRVKAQDQEEDILTFGLELPGQYENSFGNISQVPFVIDSRTGIVKVNDSLMGKVSFYFLLF